MEEQRLFAYVGGVIDGIKEPSTRVIHPLRAILRVAIWAVLCDRPLCWACQRENWPPSLRPRDLPDQSTLSRRLRTPATVAAMEFVHEAVLALHGPALKHAAIDGRPLPVGGSSQDRDCSGGRAVGGMGRGYKLFAGADLRQLILAFIVEPMNRAEQTVAKRLIPKLPRGVRRIVGDTIYDSMPLHAAARADGRLLYAPLREKRVGRRQQQRRLRLLKLWDRPVGKKLLKSRDVIERTFARMSGLSFGYKGLPPWARGLARVRLWVAGKILLYNSYLAMIAHPSRDA